MQWQVMYPKRRLHCNKSQNLKAQHKWECGMWLSAEQRHKHRQAFCKWPQHNCNHGEVCNIRVVVIVRIRHQYPDAKYRKPYTGVARVIYNAERCENNTHGIIAARRDVWNATRRLHDVSHLILCQKVRGSAGAIKATRNTRLFQKETRVVADVGEILDIRSENAILCGKVSVSGQKINFWPRWPHNIWSEDVVLNSLFELPAGKLRST